MRTLRFDAERQRLERAASRHEAAKNAYFDADAELVAAQVALSDAKEAAGCCDRADCERPRLPDWIECEQHHGECTVEGCDGRRDISVYPPGSVCPKHAAESARVMNRRPL